MNYRKKELALTTQQEKNIAKAIKDGKPVNIRLSAQALKKKTKLSALFLTQTQINRVNKAKKSNSGLVLKLSKKQVDYMRQQAKKGQLEGSGIGTVLASLAPTLIPMATDLIGNLLGNKKGEGMKKKSNGAGVFLPGTFGRGHEGVPLNDFLREMGCCCKQGKVYVEKN